MNTEIALTKQKSRWRFILSRTTDRKNHSKLWIIGYALLFWLVTRIIGIVLRVACVAIYNSFGIEPNTLTSFGGDPSTIGAGKTLWFAVMSVLFIVPLLEEAIFRLGLSFKKWQVALALATIPIIFIWSHLFHLSIWGFLGLGGSALAIFFLIMRFISQQQLDLLKSRYLIIAIWVTTIAFGLAHFFAFSTFSLVLLPYMLCTILIPFFAGCSIAYLRVNLGFGYGLGMHIFNNLPAAFLLFLATC